MALPIRLKSRKLTTSPRRRKSKTLKLEPECGQLGTDVRSANRARPLGASVLPNGTKSGTDCDSSNMAMLPFVIGETSSAAVIPVTSYAADARMIL